MVLIIIESEIFKTNIKIIINKNLYKKNIIDESTYIKVNDMLLKKLKALKLSVSKAKTISDKSKYNSEIKNTIAELSFILKS